MQFSVWRNILLFTLMFSLKACGGGSTIDDSEAPVDTSASPHTSISPALGKIGFNAWIGENDTELFFPSSVDGYGFYRSRNRDCDIENYASCDSAALNFLDGITIVDQSVTLSNKAYYVLEKGNHKSDPTLTPDFFNKPQGHQSLVFDNKMWVIGGYDDRYSDGVWSSVDGVNWLEVSAEPGAILFSDRYGHQSFVFDNKMWVIGGLSNGNFKNDVWSSSDGITWVEVSDDPSAILFSAGYEHQSLVFDNKMWVIGSTGVNSHNDVWSSVDGVVWVDLSADPSAVLLPKHTAHQGVVFDNKMWVIGGYDSNTGYVNDVWSSVDGITWIEVSADPAATLFSARDAFKSLVFENKLWVVGGRGNGIVKNDVWSSVDGVTWVEEVADSEDSVFIARNYHQSVVYENKLWVIGGAVSNVISNDVWSSSDGANWTEVSADPAASTFFERSYHQSVLFDNKLWVIGGTDSERHNDVWSSADGITWEKITTNSLFSARTSHQSVVFENKLWVIGGYDGTRKSDVWSTSDGVTWEEVTTINVFSGRSSHQTVVFDNKLWVIGGYNGSRLNDVWSSVDGVTWVEVSADPAALLFTARSAHQSVAFDDKLWVMGGYTGSQVNDVWSSSDGITWVEVSDNPSASLFSIRKEHRSVVFNNKLWVIGGKDGSFRKNDVWSSVNGISWVEETAAAGFSERYSHSSVVLDNRLLVIGGDDGEYRNDVWSSDDGINWRLGYKGIINITAKN